MLQDVALAIHPPMLYLGYTSLYGSFLAIICILLYSEREEYLLHIQQKFFKLCRLFTVISLTALTAGIGLGSWWAYRELGWGGYWFFDPVENISLLPWICAISMYHSLIIVLKYHRLKAASCFFGIVGFIITLYGFFFIRSGVVTSVHSFAFSPERGVYIIAICLIISFLSAMLYLCRWKKLKYMDEEKGAKDDLETGAIERDKSRLDVSSNLGDISLVLSIISLGNILWLASLLILIAAIAYPVYYSMVWDIEIAIDPSYFHSVFLPLFIPIFALAGSAPFLLKKYGSGKFSSAKKSLVLSLIFACPVILVIMMLEEDQGILGKIIAIAIILSTIYLMVASSWAFKNNIQKTRLSISAKSISMLLGHFGAGLLGFSIAINTYFSSELEFTGPKGGVVMNDGLHVTLKDIKFSDSPSYYRQIAEFEVHTHDGAITLKPENRLYKVENTLSQEVDIYSYITHDLYAVLSKIDDDVISATISYKPMISFIWLAVMLMSLGFGFILLNK